MYKAVIFDFFGVFCPDIAFAWFTKTVPGYQNKMAAFQAICTKSDYGTLSRTAFNQEVAELAGVSVDSLAKGIEAEISVNVPLVEYVQKLKSKGYRTACLSNGTHEWTLRVIRELELGDLFDEIVLSGDLGIVKPDPKIYLHTLQKLNIQASEAIFVDDRKINTDAAEACGIRSLLFANTETFISEFEALTASSQDKLNKA